MLVAPRWTQSIRFRLSLFYALSLFVTGSLVIGGIYMWQLERLDEPQLVRRQVQLIHPVTRQPVAFNLNTTEELIEVVEYTSYRQTLENLKRGSYGALAALFVVSFGTSWWVAGLALRPVHRMTRVARDITASDLSRRIALPGPDDELKGLADTFDAMLDRLETGIEDQRRFVQDASHELRNPLAVTRTNLDLVLSDPDASNEELRRSAEVARNSAERMSNLVESLLSQARSGVPELAMEEVDLADLASGVVDDHRAGARQRKVTLEMAVSDRPAAAPGRRPGRRAGAAAGHRQPPVQRPQGLASVVDHHGGGPGRARPGGGGGDRPGPGADRRGTGAGLRALLEGGDVERGLRSGPQHRPPRRRSTRGRGVGGLRAGAWLNLRHPLADGTIGPSSPPVDHRLVIEAVGAGVRIRAAARLGTVGGTLGSVGAMNGGGRR